MKYQDFTEVNIYIILYNAWLNQITFSSYESMEIYVNCVRMFVIW